MVYYFVKPQKDWKNMLKKQTLNFCSIIFLMASNVCASQHSLTDKAILFAKGAGAAFVSGCSAHAWLELSLKAYNRPEGWFEAGFDSLKALGYGYSVSKILPYSRRCFNLTPSPLLEDNPKISSDRKQASINAITRALVAIPCLFELYDNGKKMNLRAHPEILLDLVNVGKSLGLAYTLYHAMPYAYKHAKVALAV